MNERLDRGLKSALGELVIIIIGVLVALGANAWWQGRSDRAREREYLVQLAADLKATYSSLNAAYVDEDSVARACDTILLQLRSNKPLDPDSLNAWSRKVGHYSDPRLVLGTINALQQTGDLRLISDRDLRVGVSSYASGVGVDWLEFSRWIDRGLAASPVMLDEAVRRGFLIPGAANNLPRAIVAMRNAPETEIAFRGLATAAHNRRDYVLRMRDETGAILKLVEAAK